MREQTILSRSEFLAGACAVGAVVALNPAVSYASSDGASDQLEGSAVFEESVRRQYGFWVNTANCVDCGQCAHACRRKNETPEDEACRRKVIVVEDGGGQVRYVSLSCMHCCEPSCMEVCPAGAILKRNEDGIVTVDNGRCIGCKYCFQACPFEVPRYNDSGMDKCDACFANGLNPNVACAAACSHDALHFGPVDELLTLAGSGARCVSATTGPNLIIS